MNDEQETFDEGVIDEAEDQYEDSQEIGEGQMDQYDAGTYSVAKEKSDLYNWFWKVVGLMTPFSLAKVGNLSATEIGEHGISMRDSMNLANLGEIFHHKTFANYWKHKAMITSATSMAKKGWFMDLSISQKRVRHREKSSTPFEKSRIFGKKKQGTEE